MIVFAEEQRPPFPPHSPWAAGGHSQDAVIAAMPRLQTIEEEIVHLTNLASAMKDSDEQQQHWQLALQLQRDAREIRAEIRSRVQARE